jgi:hypothetical protein
MAAVHHFGNARAIACLHEEIYRKCYKLILAFTYIQSKKLTSYVDQK